MQRYKARASMITSLIRTFQPPAFFLFLIIFGNLSCKKNSTDEVIPNVPVNLTIYLSLPQYSALNSIGNSVEVSGGYRGIIVYRRSLQEFVAFDLACPYDPSKGKMELDSSYISTIHTICGSKFSLYDGSKISGPATRPMKQYNADYSSNDNAVYIFN